jgi:hypothetical protein
MQDRFFFFFIGLEVRSEDIVRVFSCGDKHLSEVRVEPKLLNIALSLVQEHKLGRYIFTIIVLHLFTFINFDGEVPNSELVIS